MHSATQILAQRAAPAIPMRNKPRWQPYYSTIQPALPPRSPTAQYLHTPITHVPPQNQPSCSTTTAREQARQTPIPPTPISQTAKESSQRDANPKHKFAAGLIDQAVNILSEIWRPHDVPDVFKASAKTASPLGGAGSMSKSFDSSLPPLSMSSKLPQHANACPETDETNLIPMKTFVHEVLKRSRTSASILQAALCYLEAIRPRVPEILDEERRGIRALYRPDSTILPATEEELRMDAELTRLENEADLQQILPIPAIASAQDSTDAIVNTVRISDSDDMDSSVSSSSAIFSANLSADSSMTSISNGKVNSSALPSPLLCPRRAFLASLILASKFFQDKCYSNRAWAKLSGLPAREIGRCERALGEALQWRLWVGKTPMGPPPAGRPVVRSQTESVLITASSADGGRPSAMADRRPLRKAATMPYASGTEVDGTRSRESYDFSAQQVGIENMSQPSSCVLDSSSSTYTESAQQCNASERVQLEKSTTATPSPDTPGLTYSPSSTDSSGDQTCQIQYEGSFFPALNSFSTGTSSLSTTPAGSSRGWFDGPVETQGQTYTQTPQARYIPTAIQKQRLFSSAAAGIYDISIGQAVPAVSVVVPDSVMLPDGYRGDEVELLQAQHQQIMDEAGMMMAKNACLWRADSTRPAYETEPVC